MTPKATTTPTCVARQISAPAARTPSSTGASHPEQGPGRSTRVVPPSAAARSRSSPAMDGVRIGGWMPKLTIMEEVALLGIKDQQVCTVSSYVCAHSPCSWWCDSFVIQDDPRGGPVCLLVPLVVTGSGWRGVALTFSALASSLLASVSVDGVAWWWMHRKSTARRQRRTRRHSVWQDRPSCRQHGRNLFPSRIFYPRL